MPLATKSAGHAGADRRAFRTSISEPEVGQEIGSTLDALDNLWGGYF